MAAKDLRELVDQFVKELNMAMKAIATYPEGHPQRAGAVQIAHETLSALLAPSGKLSLGVGRDFLLYGEEKLTATYAASLSKALYHRNVAVIRFLEGIDVDELALFLELTRRDPRRQDSQGAAEELQSLALPHLEIQAVDLTRIVLLDDEDESPLASEPTSLWDRILSELLVGRELATTRKELPRGRSAERALSLLDMALAAAAGGEDAEGGSGDGGRGWGRTGATGTDPGSARVGGERAAGGMVGGAGQAGIGPGTGAGGAGSGAGSAGGAGPETGAGSGSAPGGAGGPASGAGPGSGLETGTGTGSGSGAGSGAGPGTEPGTGTGSGIGTEGAGGGSGPGSTGSGAVGTTGGGGGTGGGADSAGGSSSDGPPAPPGPAGTGAGPGGRTGRGGSPGSEAGGGAPSQRRLGRQLGPRLAGIVEDFLGTELELGTTEKAAAFAQVKELVVALPEPVRELVVEGAIRAVAGGRDERENLESLAVSLSSATMVGAFRQLKLEGLGLAKESLQLVETLMLGEPEGEAGDLDPADAAARLEALRALLRDADIDRVPVDEIEDLFSGEREYVVPLQLPEAGAGASDLGPELAEELGRVGGDGALETVVRTLVVLLSTAGEEEVDPILLRLQESYRSLVRRGDLSSAVEVATTLADLRRSSQAADSVRSGISRLMEHLVDRNTVAELVHSGEGLDRSTFPLMHRLTEILGDSVIRHLLAALSEEEDRTRRRWAIDLLASMGSRIVPHASLLLSHGQWFVVRNALLILRQVGDRSTLPRARQLLTHADARVQREALKNLLAVEGQITPDVITELVRHPNLEVAEQAVTTLGRLKVREAGPPLVDLVRRRDPLGLRRPVRLAAFEALGELGDPTALPALRGVFRNFLPTATGEERRIAYASLAHYPVEARRPWLELGSRSRNPEIRKVCEELRSAPGPISSRPQQGHEEDEDEP